MEINANFVVPQEQINFKPVYENVNGHFNGSKYLQLYFNQFYNYRLLYYILCYLFLIVWDLKYNYLTI